MANAMERENQRERLRRQVRDIIHATEQSIIIEAAQQIAAMKMGIGVEMRYNWVVDDKTELLLPSGGRPPEDELKWWHEGTYR